MRSDQTFAIVLLISFAAIGAVLTLAFAPLLEFGPTAREVDAMTPENDVAWPAPADYLPPMPSEAPTSIRPAVLRGAELIKTAPNAADVSEPMKSSAAFMRCSSCHFEDGVTDGGRNGGFSLVGVAARYPKLDEQDRLIDLEDRIAACYAMHLNAAPPADGSDDMMALLTYCRWLSKGVPIYADEIAWLDRPSLESTEAPNPERGATVYRDQCAACHGEGGQGTGVAPPVWGQGSYTAESDMNRTEILAPFLHDNMPRRNPVLSPRQAWDVASYLHSKPRPNAPGEEEGTR